MRAAIQAQDKDSCMAHKILIRQSDRWKRNRVRSCLAWRQAGHHTTTRKRGPRLFPRRLFYGAGNPTWGIFPASGPSYLVRSLVDAHWRQAGHQRYFVIAVMIFDNLDQVIRVQTRIKYLLKSSGKVEFRFNQCKAAERDAFFRK